MDLTQIQILISPSIVNHLVRTYSCQEVNYWYGIDTESLLKSIEKKTCEDIERNMDWAENFAMMRSAASLKMKGFEHLSIKSYKTGWKKHQGQWKTKKPER